MPWSRNTLWRQGSVLSNANFKAAGLTNPTNFDMAVAISHDCDIANDKITNGTYIEPVVEFVFARIIDKQDGNNTYGKNPRILHLGCIHEGKSTVIELVATEKVIVFKDILETFEPDDNHDLKSSRQVLQIWLSEFTVRRMRETEEYRLEYLSYRKDPPEPSISG